MNRLEKGQVSRRERQILEILYRLEQGTAKEVQENLPDPPSYSAVRALLATLEGKDMVSHSRREGATSTGQNHPRRPNERLSTASCAHFLKENPKTS